MRWDEINYRHLAHCVNERLRAMSRWGWAEDFGVTWSWPQFRSWFPRPYDWRRDG